MAHIWTTEFDPEYEKCGARGPSIGSKVTDTYESWTYPRCIRPAGHSRSSWHLGRSLAWIVYEGGDSIRSWRRRSAYK